MGNKQWPFDMPSFDVKGKTAVVTGATKGLGYGIAVTLAYFGANVLLTSRHQDECDEVANEIRDMGGRAIGVQTDVTDMDQVYAMIQRAVDEFGGVDILVNNAGMAVTKFAVDVTRDDYDRVMDSNLRSVYFGCQAAARQMIEQGRGGSIINIASIGGIKGSNALSTYGSSKAAVINLTKDFAVEWGRYNIRVNAICPGYVKTAMNMEQLQDPAYVKRTLKSIPLKRFGEIGEVASVAAFLASDASSIMTGAAVVADMGATLE